MVLDLGISRVNGVLRAATFGNGVFERKLFRPHVIAVVNPNGGEVYGGGQTITIQWSEKFLNNVKLEYSLDNGANWNLIATNVSAATGSYAWTVPDVATTEGKIRISEASSGQPVDVSNGVFTIVHDPDVFAGWNMLSIHLLVLDSRKTTLFPNASSSAFSYNGTYIPSDTLEPGMGYWLKFDAAQNVTYTGDSILTDTIPVLTGWNMIGSLSKPITVTAVTSSPPGIITSSFFGFNSSYAVADSLMPRQGYWIRVSADGQLILKSTPAQIAKSNAARDVASFNSVTMCDAEGRKQSVYFTTSGVDHGVYDMPPLPPDGAFDVRFESQRYVETIRPESKTSIPVLLHDARYPLTIRWDIKEAVIEEATLRAAERSISLIGSGEVIIDQQSSDRFTLEVQSGVQEGIPTAFMLEQNYPNPFNPVTRLSFSVSQPAPVNVKVFDALGKEVATIVEEELQPGRYTRMWDATKFASGVYYYRLTTPSFTQTKKMVLVR